MLPPAFEFLSFSFSFSLFIVIEFEFEFEFEFELSTVTVFVFSPDSRDEISEGPFISGRKLCCIVCDILPRPIKISGLVFVRSPGRLGGGGAFSPLV